MNRYDGEEVSVSSRLVVRANDSQVELRHLPTPANTTFANSYGDWCWWWWVECGGLTGSGGDPTIGEAAAKESEINSIELMDTLS